MAMALRSLQSLLLVSLSITLLALAQEKDQFIYHGFHEANLRTDGIGQIHPNGLLQLTNTSKQQIGHAFYPFPLKLNTSSSGVPQPLLFSTTFVFAMVPELPNVSGHGIVFTISPSMEFTGAMASQYMGLFNPTTNGNSLNHVFAIELDTIRSPEFGDIDSNHVGVDVNGLTSIESATATFFSAKEGKNKSLGLISGDPMQVWIDYDGVEKKINVTLAPMGTSKPSHPLLSTSIDISSIILDSMYVGFSSSTGAVASSHYILGWSFSTSGQAQKLDLSRLPPLPPRRKSKGNQGLTIVLSLTILAVVLVTITGALYMARMKKYAEIREDWELEYGPHRFSYKELYKAAKGFKDKELLGAGGFGKVYRGVLRSSNTRVAVKRVSHDSKQGMKEFVAEIASMGRLRHRNLVELLGYCRRRGELLLVYDYMPNGSLDKLLFSNETPNLSWFQRYRILRDVASSLLYLHEECEQVVLHRDVKASNVLLDADLNGRLGDFGLARLYDHGANPHTTHVVGTIGYLAPELTRTGKATTSTDVYAFGAFMLEVACGRRPIESKEQPEKMILVDWVIECWKRGAILETRDPRLGDYYVVEEMGLVLKLGLLCSHPMSAARPSMRQVMQYLDGDAILPEISPDTGSIGDIAASNEGFDDLFMSYSSLSGKASICLLSSADSTLAGGR
ncbi:hypothetical protein HHK36_016351 [Tetracentron sinense]|uniref:non-specific serine/threonine protein kinase n=1 Tax=Tetracentron sinense TaxID=13715 RepID=A0A834Z0L1_TETSI|nr:hypothetical protein HHK36_016351 [Tetracentron sinense]